MIGPRSRSFDEIIQKRINFFNSEKGVATKVWLNNRVQYVLVRSKREMWTWNDSLPAALGPVILFIHALRAALTVQLDKNEFTTFTIQKLQHFTGIH